MNETVDQSVFEQVMVIVKKHSSDQAACQNAKTDSHLLNDLHLNSARIVDVILDFEDAFNIQIADSDFDSIATVGDAVVLIQQLQKPA